MNTTEMNNAMDAALSRKLRELASDLADRVAAGEISEIEANETMARCQDRWSDSPWG